MADDVPTWDQVFIDRMARERTRLDVSQSELAKLVNAAAGLSFHQPTVQRIEAGERPVRLHEAMVIAEALGFDLVDVLQPPAERVAARLQSWVSGQRKRFTTIENNTFELLEMQAIISGSAVRLRDQSPEHAALADQTMEAARFMTPERAVEQGRRISGLLGSDDHA